MPIAGPLELITVTTSDLGATRRFYCDGLGLTLKGPCESGVNVQEAQRALWAMDEYCQWREYRLVRDEASWSAGIRLLVVDPEREPGRPDWKPATLGPYTIGFPNTRQRELDQQIRKLGFGALNDMEVTTFTTPEGDQYQILETIFLAPDSVAAVGVARGEGLPSITPVDVDGMGGPAYSMAIVRDVDAMAAFMTSVFGYRLKTRRRWQSTGSQGALNVPDGTEFEFAQLIPPDSDFGFFIFIDFLNLAVREPSHAARPGRPGIGLYSILVHDLPSIMKRATAGNYEIFHPPVRLRMPDLGQVYVATIRAPNRMLFEAIQVIQSPRTA